MKKRRLRRLFGLDRFGRRMDESLEDEVRFHLEIREAQHGQAGLSPQEAFDVLGKNPSTTFVVIEEVELESWGIGGLPVDDVIRAYRALE